MIDVFPRKTPWPHIVAVTVDTILETPDPNVTTVISRGLYGFSSFKAARHFKALLNDTLTATDDANIAHLFSQKEPTND